MTFGFFFDLVFHNEHVLTFENTDSESRKKVRLHISLWIIQPPSIYRLDDPSWLMVRRSCAPSSAPSPCKHTHWQNPCKSLRLNITWTHNSRKIAVRCKIPFCEFSINFFAKVVHFEQEKKLNFTSRCTLEAFWCRCTWLEPNGVHAGTRDSRWRSRNSKWFHGPRSQRRLVGSVLARRDTVCPLSRIQPH